MAIRYVDIEPGDGKAKPARTAQPPSKPVPEVAAEEAAPAVPAAKPKRRKK